ncbi:MAG TPA: hypothetical protein VGL42_06305 [Opitutaceae bacterium]|jgi:hypothetical protein
MILFALLAMASPTRANEGPVVQLPSFVVRDNRVLPGPQRWDYASVTGIEALSDADPAQAKALLTDFVEFHRAIAAVWPLEREEAAVPAMLILCGEKARARPFVPADAPAGVDSYLSMSIQDREMASIVIDLDPAVLATGSSDDTAEILRREFIHLVISRLGRLPPWIRQGLWTAFSTMRCSDQAFEFPAIDGGAELKSRQAGDLSALATAEKSGSFLPLSALFAASFSGGDETTSPWSRECYQFVHYCLVGEPQRYRVPFLEYVQATQTASVDEALFRKYFHRGYSEFTAELWKYTGFAAPVGFRLTTPGGKASPLPPIHFQRATDAQSGRITGETLRMQGKSEAAHWALIAPYLRGVHDPELLASLGLQEVAAGNDGRARSFLAAATTGGTVRARAWAELGRLRLRAFESQAGPTGALTSAQVHEVVGLLIKASRLPPPLAEELQYYRETMAHAPRARNALPPAPSK